MLIPTNSLGNQDNNRIGRRYKILQNSTQTPYLQSINPNTPTLKVEFYLESSPSDESSSKEEKKVLLFFQCIALINLLFAVAPERLKEVYEVIERVAKHYKDYGTTSSLQDLEVVKEKVLSNPINTSLVFDSVKRRRQAGSAKGLITISDDFDEPLEDFKDYME
jgi:hypothetical protein